MLCKIIWSESKIKQMKRQSNWMFLYLFLQWVCRKLLEISGNLCKFQIGFNIQKLLKNFSFWYYERCKKEIIPLYEKRSVNISTYCFIPLYCFLVFRHLIYKGVGNLMFNHLFRKLNGNPIYAEHWSYTITLKLCIFSILINKSSLCYYSSFEFLLINWSSYN